MISAFRNKRWDHVGAFPSNLSFLLIHNFFWLFHKINIHSWSLLLNNLQKQDGLFDCWTWDLMSRETWEKACWMCFMLRMIKPRPCWMRENVWSHKHLCSGLARHYLSAFAHALPSSWNTVSLLLHHLTTSIISSFKTRFRYHLLQEPFSTTSGCTECPSKT